MAFLICGSETINKEKSNGQKNNNNLNQETNRKNDDKIVTMVIRRGKRGYGFSVIGSSPATVRRIEQGSTASEAGLRVGDAMISINGVDVSKSIADSVAMAVRQSPRHVVLDVLRSGPEEAPPPVLDWSTLRPTSPDCVSLLSTRDGSSADPSDDRSRVQFTDLHGRESKQLTRCPLPAIQIRFLELTDEQRQRQRSVDGLRRCEQDFVETIRAGVRSFLDPLRSDFVSPAEHETLFNNIQNLLAMSENHIQNIRHEGIVFCDATNPEQLYVDVIGSIYLPKVQSMAEGFSQYCNGVKNSFRLLAELREFDEFSHFLQQCAAQPGHVTITEFLQKPLEHIKNVVLFLQEILLLTPTADPDMNNLSYVVDALRNTCNLINDRNTRRSRSMTSLVSRSSRRTSLTSTSSRSSASSGISSGSSTGSSIDSEVLDIQTRLLFPEHVQAFQLATATRHVVYSGELTHVDDTTCTELFVVLMSDLLLLTRVEPDNTLLVVDYPILLHDIVETDWTDNTTTDFVIGVESNSNPTWMEPHDVTFTAPSTELKYTWKNILSHRMKCLERQENVYNRSKVLL